MRWRRSSSPPTISTWATSWSCPGWTSSRPGSRSRKASAASSPRGRRHRPAFRESSPFSSEMKDPLGPGGRGVSQRVELAEEEMVGALDDLDGGVRGRIAQARDGLEGTDLVVGAGDDEQVIAEGREAREALGIHPG